MMMITKNSYDLSHRGIEIESQNNIKPSANSQKSIFKHFGALTFQCSNLVHRDLNYNKFLMLLTDKYRE